MRPRGSSRRLPLLWLLASGLSLIGQAASGAITHLEYIGQARIPGGSKIGGTPVGGLSGITFEASRNLFLVVTDDPSARASARFYELELDLADGQLKEGGARLVDVTEIQSPEGGPMPRGSLDPEGITLHPDGSLYISSEGQVRQGVAPFVRHYDRGGRYLGELELPERYRPSQDESRGPRHNLGFESLTLTQEGHFLFTAMENSLVQDGPRATLDVGSPSRLLRFDVATGNLAAEYLYWTEPVAAPSSVPDGLEVTGVVDMLALDESTLLAMERSFSMGVGNSIRLFLVDLAEATDVSGQAALSEVDLNRVVPAKKELLLDLAELEIYLDNLEGMTFGPDHEDGRRTLILVSDDNFNPLIQTTQLLAFALGEEPLDVEDVQGASHTSPLEGRWVRGIEGVVTSPYPEKEKGFWMEAATTDGDPATSRGILVVHDEEISTASPGEAVVVDGWVVEIRRARDLGTTTLQASSVRPVAGGLPPLPPPISVGPADLRVPGEVVDDDGLQLFEPRFDGLDFWESLEGMRVALTRAPVVGPTNRYGDISVDANGSPGADAASRAGGLLLRPGDLNPERLILDYAGIGEPPVADVGARFAADLVGVVGYRYSTYRLYVQSPLPELVASNRQPEATNLAPGDDRLTVATFNVLNLSARSSDRHFQSLARTLSASLKGPDVVALQEIQDDTGPEDDGTVSASQTLRRLTAAVAGAGGPSYEYRQIDPANSRDGGQPGSNIRLAFLFNPDRVQLVERGEAGPFDAVRAIEIDGGIGLSANPGRIAPQAPAFNGDETRGFSASRKPLVAEFQFGPHRLFVINNHWSSKGSDDPVFGQVQPPVRHSEDQRSQQARLVSDFVIEILSLDADAGVIVLGDLNDHEFRTPLRVLTETPLENLVFRLPVEDRYSFNYRGDSQLLDHILLSLPLLARTRVRFDIVHANSDLADARSSSDHDPLLVELDFSPPE